ncbi:MAG: signal peptide peptidase SppA [Euryarchaeota archaeon]|nr:signal peptide peptidase SppA [Euryarchaeota archaeon]
MKSGAALLAILALATLATFALLWTAPGDLFHILPQERVAVIHIQGPLFSAQVPEGLGIASSESITQKLRDADSDPTVRAVVLRVNSPGGTPSASQEIVSEIQRLHKPLVVSMGDVAASGAYYISAPAQRIYANNDTLTGSIGVIWLFENKSEFFEKEGTNHTVIKSGKFKDIGASYRGPTPEEERYAQGLVDEVYQRFLDVVAQGRGLPPEKVRNLSDGRVFTGAQAQREGLVDSIGNLYDAIEEAGRLGNISGTPQVKYANRPFDLPFPFGGSTGQLSPAALRYWDETRTGKALLVPAPG